MRKEPTVVQAIKRDLRAAASKEKAAFLPRFFKTGKGEYGEGDIFLGVAVPQARAIALKYVKKISFPKLAQLIYSPIHEERFVAFEILVYQFEQGDEKTKKAVFDFYLAHKSGVNNWDLVDTSAPYIVGEHLFQNKKSISLLKKLARSKSLWDRRIAMVSTYAFIRGGSDKECHEISDLLMADSQDLIHKAVGWMLREAGKRVGRERLEVFLESRYKTMPRTMLRYAIEHFSKAERKKYLLSKK